MGFFLSVFILLFVASSTVEAQKDSVRFFQPSPVLNKNRLAMVAGTEATLYAGSIIGLNALWYKDYPRSSFHFFNDNYEWMGMDKAGHVVTSASIGVVGMDLLKWSGVERKKAIWYGGALGSLYQSTIEILDGFSSGWGFSVGDFASNTAGSAFVIGQELLWNEQRFVLKVSYNKTSYANYRPEVLGSTWSERVFKDYNGQTYWISMNISSFIQRKTIVPKWLNIAAGYGAEGMTGGEFNPPFNKKGDPIPDFERYPQFYLSLDADLTRLPVKSRFLKTLFKTFGFIKIPTPTLVFSKKGVNAKL